MSETFVREARLSDAAEFAAVQHRAWTAASAELGLPGAPELSHIERGWERAITVPPSKRHHSWVAVEVGAADSRVVGVAAVAPASDPDLDDETAIELVLLTVDPSARRRGHGSRLLTAAMHSARDAGEPEAVAWLASADDATRQFLEGAGWAADGAFRTLADGDETDGGQLRQLRLATSLASSDEVTS